MDKFFLSFSYKFINHYWQKIIFIYQKGELLIFLTPHVIDDQILDGSNQEEIDLVLEKKKNQ